MTAGVGLYVHFPFCKSKCSYCDFNSYSGKEHLFDRYLEALKREMFFYREHVQIVNTIYFGGGTPSILGARYLVEVLDAIRRRFYVDNKVEITVEVNPGTVSRAFFSQLRAAGVNRLSIGLQSFSDDILHKLGRIHTVNEFHQAYADARESGFENVNVDLIFALPWQTLESWRQDLSRVIECAPEHISLYGLTIEPHTPLAEDIRARKIQRISEEAEALMYEEAIRNLKIAGFEHYEISNFARPGKRCRHNQLYWRNQEYVGIGAGATSYLGKTRFTNANKVEDYIEKVLTMNTFAVQERETLTTEHRVGETIMLQLRLLEGFDKSELQKKCKADIDALFGPTISVLVREGLVLDKGGRICLTERGLMVANQVFQRFV